MDGRDIGTVVFPKAELKIFMTADNAVRVERRFKELYAKNPNVTIEEVKNNLEMRDYIDSHREVSPLRKAEDALHLPAVFDRGLDGPERVGIEPQRHALLDPLPDLVAAAQVAVSCSTPEPFYI